MVEWRLYGANGSREGGSRSSHSPRSRLGAWRNAYRLKGNADGKPRRLSEAQPGRTERTASVVRSRALDFVTAHTRVRGHCQARSALPRSASRVGLAEQFVRQIESGMSVSSTQGCADRRMARPVLRHNSIWAARRALDHAVAGSERSPEESSVVERDRAHHEDGLRFAGSVVAELNGRLREMEG